MTKKDEKLAIAGGLRYVGDGSAFDGIPARDLTQDEAQAIADQIPMLLDSGLYVSTSAPITPKDEA
jgi:hypothetical protein